MRLTRDEIILVAGLLITLVIGGVVKQYRARHREAAAVAVPAESGTRTTSRR